MRSGLMIAALLCFIAWMSLAHASTHGRVSSCCQRWSNTKGIHHSKIRNYTLQVEGVCPIRAVVFHTIIKKRICSDPNDSWTRKTISMLDQRQASKMQRSKAEEPTSTITPTASALSERFSDKLQQTTLTSPRPDPDSTRTAAAAAMTTDKEPQMLQMKGNNEDGSTTTITPTASSAPTSKPKKKGRRPRRRLRKKGRSGRKWMKKKVHVVCEHSVSMD